MIVLSLAVVAAAYAAGIVRASRRGLGPDFVAVVAFALALVVATSVLLGPVERYADTSLAWHMGQHLVLAFVVAPLVLLGAPVRVALAALPRGASVGVARLLAAPPLRLLAHPAFAWLQFTGVLYVAHFSPLYEAALEHPPAHVFEHALFVASALLFWMPVLAVAPAPHAPSHAVRLLLLFLALPMSAFLGFILYATRAPLYAHYAALPGARADQQNAGALMWIAGSGPVLLELLWCVADWGARERRLGALADRLERA